LEWKKLCEVDPSCTKKNTVIVTKIFNPPLPEKYKGTGKHGKYADFLRPLLLSLVCFEGKYTTLANKLGLWGRFLNDIKSRSPGIADQLKHQPDENDFNLWSISDYTPAGESECKHIFNSKTKEILKNTLQSLEKDGIILFQEFYKIFPDTDVVMENFETRCRSNVEEHGKRETCCNAIDEEASKKNAVLNPSQAKHLILGYDFQCCEKELFFRDVDHMPIVATQEQVKAIENYQLYVRQCAVKEYYRLEELPGVEEYYEISNAWQFFQNRKLVQKYKQIDEKLKVLLFGNVMFWKELRYEVVNVEAVDYWLKEDFDAKRAADQVSQEVLNYVDNQLQKRELEAGPNDLNDIHLALGKPKVGQKYTLKNYTSAVRFYKKVKVLYENEPTSSE